MDRFAKNMRMVRDASSDKIVSYAKTLRGLVYRGDEVKVPEIGLRFDGPEGFKMPITPVLGDGKLTLYINKQAKDREWHQILPLVDEILPHQLFTSYYNRAYGLPNLMGRRMKPSREEMKRVIERDWAEFPAIKAGAYAFKGLVAASIVPEDAAPERKMMRMFSALFSGMNQRIDLLKEVNYMNYIHSRMLLPTSGTPLSVVPAMAPSFMEEVMKRALRLHYISAFPTRLNGKPIDIQDSLRLTYSFISSTSRTLGGLMLIAAHPNFEGVVTALSRPPTEIPEVMYSIIMDAQREKRVERHISSIIGEFGLRDP